MKHLSHTVVLLFVTVIMYGTPASASTSLRMLTFKDALAAQDKLDVDKSALNKTWEKTIWREVYLGYWLRSASEGNYGRECGVFRTKTSYGLYLEQGHTNAPRSARQRHAIVFSIRSVTSTVRTDPAVVKYKVVADHLTIKEIKGTWNGFYTTCGLPPELEELFLNTR